MSRNRSSDDVTKLHDKEVDERIRSSSLYQRVNQYLSNDQNNPNDPANTISYNQKPQPTKSHTSLRSELQTSEQDSQNQTSEDDTLVKSFIPRLPIISHGQSHTNTTNGQDYISATQLKSPRYDLLFWDSSQLASQLESSDLYSQKGINGTGNPNDTQIKNTPRHTNNTIIEDSGWASYRSTSMIMSPHAAQIPKFSSKTKSQPMSNRNSMVGCVYETRIRPLEDAKRSMGGVGSPTKIVFGSASRCSLLSSQLRTPPTSGGRRSCDGGVDDISDDEREIPEESFSLSEKKLIGEPRLSRTASLSGSYSVRKLELGDDCDSARRRSIGGSLGVGHRNRDSKSVEEMRKATMWLYENSPKVETMRQSPLMTSEMNLEEFKLRSSSMSASGCKEDEAGDVCPRLDLCNHELRDRFSQIREVDEYTCSEISMASQHRKSRTSPRHRQTTLFSFTAGANSNSNEKSSGNGSSDQNLRSSDDKNNTPLSTDGSVHMKFVDSADDKAFTNPRNMHHFDDRIKTTEPFDLSIASICSDEDQIHPRRYGRGTRIGEDNISSLADPRNRLKSSPKFETGHRRHSYDETLTMSTHDEYLSEVRNYRLHQIGLEICREESSNNEGAGASSSASPSKGSILKERAELTPQSEKLGDEAMIESDIQLDEECIPEDDNIKHDKRQKMLTECIPGLASSPKLKIITQILSEEWHPSDKTLIKHQLDALDKLREFLFQAVNLQSLRLTESFPVIRRVLNSTNIKLRMQMASILQEFFKRYPGEGIGTVMFRPLIEALNCEDDLQTTEKMMAALGSLMDCHLSRTELELFNESDGTNLLIKLIIHDSFQVAKESVSTLYSYYLHCSDIDAFSWKIDTSNINVKTFEILLKFNQNDTDDGLRRASITVLTILAQDSTYMKPNLITSLKCRKNYLQSVEGGRGKLDEEELDLIIRCLQRVGDNESILEFLS